LLAFVLSFIPPSQISTGSNTVWFTVLILGCAIFVALPFIIYAMRKPEWQDKSQDNQFQPFHWETPATAQTTQNINTPKTTTKTTVKTH
jgi:hypothetical protein